MPSAEVLERPEEMISPSPEGGYIPDITEKQPKPEIPVPGPGDFVIHRTSKFGHFTMTRMHIKRYYQ